MLKLYKILILDKFIISKFEYLLVYFYVILGINDENRQLQRVVAYLYILARVIYYIRILFIKIILLLT